MGVWIEILPKISAGIRCKVTPFMGVWIEISNVAGADIDALSHPLWVCGLKSRLTHK